MNELSQALPHLTQYYVSLCAMAFLILTILTQNFLTAPFAFVKREQVPGMPLNGDHKTLSFRVIRTYENSAENLPIILGALLLAILIGVSPFWVNLLVAIHVICRMLFWVIYYSGYGKPAGGARTMAYVGGLITNIVLIAMVLFQLSSL